MNIAARQKGTGDIASPFLIVAHSDSQTPLEDAPLYGCDRVGHTAAVTMPFIFHAAIAVAMLSDVP